MKKPTLLKESDEKLESVAAALFDKIRARFEDVSVGDKDAKAVTDPGQARAFNFDYIDKLGNNFGNITIRLKAADNNHSVQFFFGRNISSNLDDAQKAEWFDFLRDMRMFAKRNLFNFDAHDITRSNLDIKDLQQLSAAEKPKDSNSALSVSESKLYGTAKTSYDTIAPGVRLIIRHSGAVDESIHGARSRKIHKIYIEDAEGQRFKSPFTHVGGSRALARHIAHGGQINDDFAGHVKGLVEELGKLKNFVRGSRNKTFEDGEANEIVSAAKERHAKIRHILHHITGNKGYKTYKEQWSPGAENLQDDIDTESLRNKFTTRKFDERMEDGLPYAHRAYQSMQKEFAESMEQIAEGTWAVPDNDIAIKHLQELMTDVLPAGIDGTDAQGALYDFLGDDELFDRIYDASKGSPEMDVRPIVYDWLKSNMPSVFEKVKASMEGGSEEAAPALEEPAQEDPNAQQDPNAQDPNAQQQPQESIQRESSSDDYYSVEADSSPFYIHSTRFIDSAQQALRKAHLRGQDDAAIYQISVMNGKKVKKKVQDDNKISQGMLTLSDENTPDEVVESSDQLSAIRRLAGLK